MKVHPHDDAAPIAAPTDAPTAAPTAGGRELQLAADGHPLHGPFEPMAPGKAGRWIVHLKRAFLGNQNSDTECYTGESKQFLCGLNPNVERRATRYGLWRKSVLYVGSFFSFLCILLLLLSTFEGYQKVQDANDTHDKMKKTLDEIRVDFKEMKSDMKANQDDISDPDYVETMIKFADKSLDVLDNFETESKNVVYMREALFGMRLVNAVVMLISFVFVLLAALKWNDVKVSVGRVRTAWTLAFAVPFVLSLIPMSLLLRANDDIWDNVNQIAESGGDAFILQFDEITDSQLDLIEDTSEAAFFSLMTAAGGYTDATEKMQFIVKNVLKPMSAVIRGAPFGLMNFVTLVPLAMSLFPALSSGAKAVRSLMPLRNEMGFVIRGLPLLQIPLLLALWSFALQVFPHFLLIAGILLLIFSPLPFIVKSKKFTDTKKTDEFDKFAKKRGRISTLLTMLGYLCIVLWILISPYKDQIMGSGDSALLQLLIAIISFLRGFLLTSVMFTDFMLVIVGSIQRFSNEIEDEGKEAEKLLVTEEYVFLMKGERENLQRKRTRGPEIV
eukprot:TRINITY_DN213_c0_g1_i10.p1 TRINITY_DN213_c0_g1~~TRINITY_DN213_c0_g1_i10.p1  ORF type:complete len:624 (-),score=150.28 TRINITY_DN213_c0_g1_i10:438-2108(-)